MTALMTSGRASLRNNSSRRTVRVGFIPLVDCASIVVAADQGFAVAEGLDLVLCRESSWAAIRDHLNLGYIDAAHMLAGMPIAASLGIGHVRVPTLAPLSLNLNGNAITVSINLHERMHETGEIEQRNDPSATGSALKRVITERARKGKDPLTFGMVYPFSCHNYELRYWMAASGIDPDRDVRLVVIPPPLMVESLRSGVVHGFCVGEPWNSLAVDAGVGRIILSKTAIWQLGPEKVLGVRADWAEREADVLFALIRALHAAAIWADAPENRSAVARLLAARHRLDFSQDLIEHALRGRLAFTQDGSVENVDNFLVFHRHAATFPWVSHALWIYSQMRRWGQAPANLADLEIVRGVFRPDLYRQALGEDHWPVPLCDKKIEGAAASLSGLAAGSGTIPFGPDRFFDAHVFDPDDIDGYLATLRANDRGNPSRSG
ncbi:MAG: ABC transporter substrate-binding protein [Hyphomicrobiales bacterium]|nr:ABC transporter substrate-binding protein [Hyphomicrobiales bacterium]